MKNLLLSVLFLFSATLLCQEMQFNGNWTKINTSYDFEFNLVLKINSINQVDGYFIWKVASYDKHSEASKEYYKNRIGMTAIEYVKGSYDQLTKEFTLKGYKKKDPNSIIGLDIYNLVVDSNGNIGGTTNANGSGLGRINGQSELDLL